uniref:Putative ovule protein n=1 Tax=Solanum chacoense TaxID=4108 RepID=A0A0V0GPJ7_SOLCH
MKRYPTPSHLISLLFSLLLNKRKQPYHSTLSNPSLFSSSNIGLPTMITCSLGLYGLPCLNASKFVSLDQSTKCTLSSF